MDYVIDDLQVEVNTPNEAAVVGYAQAFINLVEEVEEDA